MHKPSPNAPKRLSISPVRRQPSRAFTPTEMAILRLVADTLIPVKEGYLHGSGSKDFVALVSQAAMIYDAKFEILEALLVELASIPPDHMWDHLRHMSKTKHSEFTLLSTIVVAAYIYCDEIKNELHYPRPHQNPAGMFEIADELSSGILDPVIERGTIFVDAD